MLSRARVGRLLFLVEQKASTISIPEECPCAEARTSHPRKTRLPHFPDPTQPETISTPDLYPWAGPRLACTSYLGVPAHQCSPVVQVAPTPSPLWHNLFRRRHPVRLEDLHRRGMRRKAQARKTEGTIGANLSVFRSQSMQHGRTGS